MVKLQYLKNPNQQKPQQNLLKDISQCNQNKHHLLWLLEQNKTIQPIPTTKSFTTTETKPIQNRTYNLGHILETKKSSKTGQD